MDQKASRNPTARPNVFLCPFCREILSRLDHTIVQMRGTLSCETFSVTTTFSLSATLGCYGAVPADEVELKPGAAVDFSCPHCRRSFTTPYNEKLSALKMIDGEGNELLVVFDRINGEHSSFVIDVDRHEVIGTYGEHCALFLNDVCKSPNFFGS